MRHVGRQEQEACAVYVAAMAAELRELALRARLTDLAYLLGMAEIEAKAQAIARTTVLGISRQP